MTQRQKAFLAVLLGTLIGGLMAAVTKLGLREFPPITFATIRFIIASLIIAPFLVSRKLTFKGNFFQLFLVSIFASINIILFVIGINITTAVSSQVIYAATPLLIGFLNFFLFKEKLNTKQFFGILIGFLGVLLVVNISGDFRGNLILSLAVIFWSLYMGLSKRIQKHYSPFVITASFIFTTTLVLIPFCIYEILTTNLSINITYVGLLALLYVTLFGTILSYFLNQYAILHGGTIFASTLFYLSPVVGFVGAMVLVGEQLTLVVIVGAILALIGVYFVTNK